MVTCTCDYNFCFQSAIGPTTFNELLIFLPSLFSVVQRTSCQRKENGVKSMSELTVNCFKFLLSQIQTFIITVSNYHFLKYCGSFTYEILETSRSEWWVRAGRGQVQEKWTSCACSPEQTIWAKLQGLHTKAIIWPADEGLTLKWRNWCFTKLYGWGTPVCFRI